MTISVIAVYPTGQGAAPHERLAPPELEKFVSAKVQSGRYNSASEVVREALRLLEEHDSARATQMAEFNQEIGRRLASLDRGEAIDPAAARARPSALRRNLVREKPFPAPSEPKAPFPRHHPGRVSGLAGKRCLLLYRMGGNKNNAHQSSTPKHGSRRRFMLLRKQEQCPPDTIRVGMDAIQSRDPAVIRGSVSAVAKILHHCANGCILVSGV